MSWADPEGGQGVRDPFSWKSQVAIDFLKNSGTDHPCDYLLLEGGPPYDFVKYVDC